MVELFVVVEEFAEDGDRAALTIGICVKYSYLLKMHLHTYVIQRMILMEVHNNNNCHDFDHNLMKSLGTYRG